MMLANALPAARPKPDRHLIEAAILRRVTIRVQVLHKHARTCTECRTAWQRAAN